MTERKRFEPSPKRVRAFVAGRAVLDTRDAKLVWEAPHYPQYYVPSSDIRHELLPEGAVLCTHTHPALPDHVRLAWDKMDAWFEEDEEVFVHPHDPHKRIDILRSSRHVEVWAADVKLAESRRPTMLFETGAPVRTYLPQVDVSMELLEQTTLRTGCAYKGFARYWRIAREGAAEREIAWSYATPLPEAQKIAGMIAFYDERVKVVVA